MHYLFFFYKKMAQYIEKELTPLQRETRGKHPCSHVTIDGVQFLIEELIQDTIDEHVEECPDDAASNMALSNRKDLNEWELRLSGDMIYEDANLLSDQQIREAHTQLKSDALSKDAIFSIIKNITGRTVAAGVRSNILLQKIEDRYKKLTS